MDYATRGRIGGTEAALRDKGFEIAKRNISKRHSMETWKARVIEQYGPCEEPELSTKARLMYSQSQRRNALGRKRK